MTADICTVGGGMAGLCAATAAARQGAKVVLVQDRPVLGGNASGEVRVHIGAADREGARPFCRETGLLEEIRLENSVRNPLGAHPVWDLVLYEFAVGEPNLTLLLNSTCTGVSMEGSRIRAALVRQDANWLEFEVEAAAFIDCSGDGRLAFAAGAEHRRGREARSEFGESAARETADERGMGFSILYQTRDAGRPVRFGQFPGRRSGLRLLGDHTLRQQDLQEPPGFPDGVAYGGWSMDRHPPEGFFSPEPPADFLDVPDVYAIPLGCLYSRNVENLYLAGRCQSAAHVAASSARTRSWSTWPVTTRRTWPARRASRPPVGPASSGSRRTPRATSAGRARALRTRGPMRPALRGSGSSSLGTRSVPSARSGSRSTRTWSRTSPSRSSPTSGTAFTPPCPRRSPTTASPANGADQARLYEVHVY